MSLPNFQTRASLIGCMFHVRLRLSERRVAAKRIEECLRKWQTAGPLLLLAIRALRSGRLLQRWWRGCWLKLLTVQGETAKRWLQIERAEIHKQQQQQPQQPQQQQQQE